MGEKNIDKKTGINAAFEIIRRILNDARSNAYRAVNFTMVQAYWNIGQVIVEEEQHGKDRAEYGEHLIAEISKKLTQEFGKGFNERNLWYMKNFYLSFPKVNALRSELTWTHYRLLRKYGTGREPSSEFYQACFLWMEI